MAEKYNKAGTPVFAPASGKQIGEGVYTSPGPGQWGSESNWYVLFSTSS